MWASALRAGRSFAQALDSIVDEAGEPAHTEFRRAQQQVRLGVPVEQALDEMSQRLRSESFELVVLTTDVQRRVGGNVAEIFDQVADTVRRRHQFSARVKALTSMGRLSAQVLIGMPFAMAGLLTLINHGYMTPLYTTRAGHILIAVGPRDDDGRRAHPAPPGEAEGDRMSWLLVTVVLLGGAVFFALRAATQGRLQVEAVLGRMSGYGYAPPRAGADPRAWLRRIGYLAPGRARRGGRGAAAQARRRRLVEAARARGRRRPQDRAAARGVRRRCSWQRRSTSSPCSSPR